MEEFLKQRAGAVGKTLGSTLLAWMKGDYAIPRRATGLSQALSAQSITDEECEILYARLVGTGTEAAEQRRHLADAMGGDAPFDSGLYARTAIGDSTDRSAELRLKSTLTAPLRSVLNTRTPAATWALVKRRFWLA